MTAPALTFAELDSRLGYLLGPVLSSRRPAAPLARALSALDRRQQAFVLHWVEVIDRSNYEMAYRFAAAAPTALARMDNTAAEAWIIEAMDAYDREGLHRGSRVFSDIDGFIQRHGETAAATFEDHARVLELYVCGLAGRSLKLESAAEPSTDTETLYLPQRIAAFPTRAENFRVYKILATLLWAQGRYGTFRADLGEACAAYPDPARAAALLFHLENLRLQARIAAILPGIERDIQSLHPGTPDPRCAPLAGTHATVHDSLALLASLYGRLDPPQLPWRTTLHPAARATREARIRRERGELSTLLSRMLQEHPQAQPSAGAKNGDGARLGLDRPHDNSEGTGSFELTLDGAAVAVPEPLNHLLDSILHDLGDIPAGYLQAADSAPESTQAEDGAMDGQAPASDVRPGADTHFYDEWDHQRRHYRKNWCTLRELDVAPGDERFVATTLDKYRPQVLQLRRSFEALRGEDRMLRRQPVGDDIDFDAVVAGNADLRSGLELTDRLLMRRQKAERNLAALFMVDMSGSTKGWINEAERESLVMLCEALEVLGDRYAIYGFSGLTRKRCEVFRIKRFDEAYDAAVRRRIAGITPRDYTRMGAAIRHLTTLLGGVEARTRLLVTLSDGKPDDYSDHYRGEYGIEDTRQALIEAHRAGIRPFCITIDSEARDYLPHLYGPVNWTLVDNVERLPLKVAEIYRRLTA
jgi:nitric oxide reductase NorD protein